MANAIDVGNISAALTQRLFPSVTTWNRLEGRPRTDNFERALRAEVRDPLWMLTKQWQMGEFRGSDAGSPILAKLSVSAAPFTSYRPDAGQAEAYSNELPLEAKAERRAIPFLQGAQAMSLDVRLVMGRQWLALIQGIGYRQAFINAYAFAAPDPASADDAGTAAHAEVWQSYAAVAGRALDGGKLYLYLTADASHHAYDGITTVLQVHQGPINTAAARFIAWFQRVFSQPAQASDAWIPEQLEYQFAVSAQLRDGTEKIYGATSYGQGRMDWYSVDVEAAPSPPPLTTNSSAVTPPADQVQTVIPSPVSFPGMPNTRWWTFEDSRTNFANIDASTTDLAKLLFMDFALVYANDWFAIPLTLPSSSTATIRGLVVTNTFGERFWILPAGTDGSRWSMFTIDVDSPVGLDTSLLLLPTTAKIQEGPPLEELLLVRDEVANMVWGVETLIPLPNGDTRRGVEAARDTLGYYQGLIASGGDTPGAPASHAPWRYQVMTTVPENWIPFIPVHVDGSNREIQLQRAAMPRVLEGDKNPPQKIRPRTTLLRQGLDLKPPQAYYLHEEEVPRSGVRIAQSFQRTRWYDGSAVTWLRVRKQVGRGEAVSGLAFDQLVAVPGA